MLFPNLNHLAQLLLLNLSCMEVLPYLAFNTGGFNYLGSLSNVQNVIACDLAET